MGRAIYQGEKEGKGLHSNSRKKKKKKVVHPLPHGKEKGEVALDRGGKLRVITDDAKKKKGWVLHLNVDT